MDEIERKAREHGGWIERTITELSSRVAELEKENAELRTRARQALLALSREWRDVLTELGVEVLIAALGDAPPITEDTHPYFVGKMDLLRQLRALADADVARFTTKEDSHP